MFHVGISREDLHFSCAKLYNELDQTSTFLDFDEKLKYDDDDKTIKAIFGEILSHIEKYNGKPGCVCICLYATQRNETRQRYIQSAIKHGFQKAEIINPEIAFFTKIMSKTSFQLENGSIVLVYKNTICHIFRQTTGKIMLCNSFEIKTCGDSFEILNTFMKFLKNETKFKPNFILHNFPKTEIIPDSYPFRHQSANFESSVQKIIPECQFSCFEDSGSLDGIVTKALILAGEEHSNFTNFFDFKLNILLGDREVMVFEPNVALPTSNSVLLCTTEEENIVYLIAFKRYPMKERNICLPTNKKILLHVGIDTNGMIFIDFKDIASTPKTQYIQQRFNIRLTEYPFQMFVSMSSKTRKVKTEMRQFRETAKEIMNRLFDLTDRQYVGIDLGTSRCFAAVPRKHGVETVALGNQGERALSSYISYEERNPKCGQVVIDRLNTHGKSTVYDIIRIMGKKFEDIKQHSSWPFEVLNKNSSAFKAKNYKNLQHRILQSNNAFLQLQGQNGIIQKHPEEVSASLLEYIKDKSQEFQGGSVFEAIIAVPTKFTTAQKESTRVAAFIAGFKVVHLIPEPVAAALAYFVNEPTTKASSILLFDLGGGTLDICVLEILNDEIQILKNAGDVELGGRDSLY